MKSSYPASLVAMVCTLAVLNYLSFSCMAADQPKAVYSAGQTAPAFEVKTTDGKTVYGNAAISNLDIEQVRIKGDSTESDEFLIQQAAMIRNLRIGNSSAQVNLFPAIFGIPTPSQSHSHLRIPEKAFTSSSSSPKS